MPDELWPLFDLRITTPRVELRPPREADQEALIRVSQRGIHDPGFMPFYHPWTQAPSPEFERNSMQHYWRCWAEWTPQKWQLPFGVFVDGEPVGVQGVEAEQFPARGVVSTGSWVGLAHQGRGIGKEMRAAVLHFAFVGLGAERAETGAFDDNERSLAVTRALGYEPNGDAIHLQGDEPGLELRFKMTRQRFERIRRDDVAIEGLDRCRWMFDLDGTSATRP